MTILGTWRWVLHCMTRHPFGSAITQTPAAHFCPCGYGWIG